MKAVFPIIFLLFCANISFGQSYELHYLEEIHQSNIPAFKFSDSAMKINQGFPLDSSLVKDMITSLVNEKLSNFSVVHLVRVKGDTSYVKSSNDETSDGIEINLTDDYRIYYQGKRIDSKRIEEDSTEKIISIVPTSKIKKINNYICQNYISTDSTHNIWFCNTLPNSINPGLTNLSFYPGAILSFEVTAKFGTQKMNVTDIKVLR